MPPSKGSPSIFPVINQGDVALLRGAIGTVESREPLTEAIELRIDGILRYLGLVTADLQTLVLAELGAGPYRDLDREPQRLSLTGQI